MSWGLMSFRMYSARCWASVIMPLCSISSAWLTVGIIQCASQSAVAKYSLYPCFIIQNFMRSKCSVKVTASG
ncbi:hypothetical protein ES703_26736 [subsurface metagenome]